MFAIKPVLSSLMRSRSGPLLLLLQIVLSVAIVANAGFIIKERLALMQRDSGVAESSVLTFSVYNFSENTNLEQQHARDLEILRGLPGIHAATTTNMIPLSGSGWSDRFVDSPDPENAKSTPGFSWYLGGEQLVDTLDVRVVEGRNFRADEVNHNMADSGMKALMTQALAKEIWPDESAVGKVMYQGSDGQIEIIGVIETLQGAWVDSNIFEYSVVQNIEINDNRSNQFMVRANRADIASLEESIKQALWQDNQDRVIGGFDTIAEKRNGSYAMHTVMATLLSVMIVLLLVITSLGLSGMVMFNIQRRTKQIGTRRALGARKRDIIGMFLVENWLICLMGGVLGGLLALELGSQLMTLYSLPMMGWQWPALTVLGLLLVTTVAVLLPARKAARISPAIATRTV